MIKVSVLIPTYHDWDRLKICLDALSKQTFPKNQFEIIVVNNFPEVSLSFNDETELNLILLEESKPGSYAARNFGIKHSKGEIFAFTDSDCIPDPYWLEEAMNVFKLDKSISRIAGKIELTFKRNKLTVAEIYEKAFAFRQEQYVDNVGAAITANMFAKREVFETVGNFNDNFLSGEDINWGIRAQNRGFKIKYCPKVVVKHPSRHLMSQLTLKARRVAGGLDRSDHRGDNSKLKTILKGFLPPIFSLKLIKNKKGLQPHEKVISFFIHYYLKIYKSFMMIIYMIGVGKKERL